MNNNIENLCLSLLTKCKTLQTTKQLQAFMCKNGLENHPLLAGKLLLHCVLTISDALDYGRRLLSYSPRPDAFMYNTLIRGLAESDSPDNAVHAFMEMRLKSISPIDSFTFAFLLKAAANLRCFRFGMELHCQALLRGLDTHLFVGTTLVSLYAECGSLNFARKVFDEMFQPNVVAWNAILTACFRCGDVKSGQELFERMPIRNLTSWDIMLAGHVKAGELELARRTFLGMSLKDDVSWSTMIVGFAQNGCFDEAFGLFRELHQLGLKPNEASLTGVLSASAQAGAFEFAKILHGFIEKAGFVWIVSVNNALLDAYSKCGDVRMTQLVFERMSERKSIVSWTSMITSLAMHGYGARAIQLFHKMENHGIKPDGVTFISILYACSHAGLIEEGQRYFSKMRDINIEPTIEHYGCMVDLYGRAGKLEKAYEFACEMPVSPNAIIWRTLLGACSLHGNVKLAEEIEKRLSRLDPNNSGDHVLLSNTYAIAGKWEDVASVRRSASEQKIRKAPGRSTIEVEKLVYSFVAGQKQNEVVKEAYEKLREIMLRLKVEGGYVPEIGSVLHDIEDEEKEDSVNMHSEKLAVAFGMARLGQGKVLRIVKNLRICRDCHVVMKLISKVYGLKIVVRDRSRFHSFEAGSCSCGDYW
ncbi:pentatricopeptide repeat-containing protein At1g74630-like [Humulus lupulus]|uniref:pentatricopeptide repeat-containing protein At1g74630-like n=1 Tax=Humulus lupulus TaxID=3486 RepID=UPI002B405D83|nr:pentatricopeptide repeat-containing protein At1g74630-like [Humulus lupulus]